MPIPTADEVLEALLTVATQPRRVRGDAGEVEQHSLKEIIEAYRLARAAESAGLSGMGVRFQKIVPPGSV
jgi:hypothetical protein